MEESCFHCALPVPREAPWKLFVAGKERVFCCPGCHGVAQAILKAGLEDYYRFRDTPAERPEPLALEGLALFDRPDVQAAFLRQEGEAAEVRLLLERIRCPACVWLNEQHLRRLPGVLEVAGDIAGHTLKVRFDPERIGLSAILRAVADLGYRAHPFDPAHRRRLMEDEKRRNGERLLFAGLIAMPVMHFSLATYLMPAAGELWVVIGRYTALIACLALLIYPGWDIFHGALRDLRRGRLGMDVPIALGLSLAFGASALATFMQEGEVYFDAIAMFVFFVLAARAFELRGRQAAARVLDRLARIEPRTARRLTEKGEEEVAVVDLSEGDRVLVAPGETVPADGVVIEGESAFDEALLSGESEPVARHPGEEVAGGAVNIAQPVVVEVRRLPRDSALGRIQALLMRAMESRPAAVALGDRAARLFVAGVFFIALAAFLWALHQAPSEALSRTIAVLIVTCPCALALAAPVALALGASRLARLGVIPLRMEALEALATARTVAFDKTGTLTRGETLEIHPLDEPEDAWAIACALERPFSHPIALAFRARDGHRLRAEAVRQVPGKGVTGEVAGRTYRLGRPDFALETADPRIEALEQSGHRVLVLAGDVPLAAFVLKEEMRPGAEELARRLKVQGIRHIALLSGDQPGRVEALARTLGIPEARGGMAPEDKLAWIRQRQQGGGQVIMVGDGVNDAPVLAAADASIALAEGTDLAQRASDFFLMKGDLASLAKARAVARKTRRIIAQNLTWALLYNLSMVPLAAMGFIPPWAAALGMSASSLGVVANAMRLRERQPRMSLIAALQP
ncbi:MAG: cadmium-translocating P-type ATPase [Gammaproteobacteria bacterium]|nr:MAG: cadmium-translocating P-type ATPase [Gammaproteobacteria bacterium]